ncbi:HsdM family class I SAM-dependent methyltransferase [Methylomicrobium sp. RS1]|uniref:HsdM family class I SAM-dependent methyltransferase n=1 Tax=Candidatus Methylomicrobium oryzae TaxID=2802053 RepID=UPI0019216B67|nr:N-6 DNA methylase [Methylomicrobium sp. RS1]MBL1266084.1 N-6 DNA methylase [Methylomicrobium sp. RS1]
MRDNPAYEYLLKDFADKAGKKAGEFYTPAEVVRVCVEICDPQENMSVYDPTVGSGGMLIQARDYLRECGGDPQELALYGQEKMGATWSICKMNMLLHGISHAVISQQDTLREPKHQADDGQLKRFDRVLANPPFSQNYIKKDIKFPGRFPVWMPEKGKKADLMFVQHMLAVLKADGRMATVMPHGVLFRGGEEREARQYFIDKGYLEAVIGLPSNLFYGTGIPACILVINKANAAQRNAVLFINADREYREGKAQNHLRPEDIDKIVHAYRAGHDVDAYARCVPLAKSRQRITTATSADMSITRRYQSRTMCERICTAGCRLLKSMRCNIFGKTTRACVKVALYHAPWSNTLPITPISPWQFRISAPLPNTSTSTPAYCNGKRNLLNNCKIGGTSICR